MHRLRFLETVTARVPAAGALDAVIMYYAVEASDAGDVQLASLATSERWADNFLFDCRHVHLILDGVFSLLGWGGRQEIN